MALNKVWLRRNWLWAAGIAFAGLHGTLYALQKNCEKQHEIHLWLTELSLHLRLARYGPSEDQVEQRETPAKEE